MKFGLAFANTMGFVDPVDAAPLGCNAEAAGSDSLWTVEHVIYPEDYEEADRDPDTIEMPMRMPPNLLAEPVAAIEQMATLGTDRLIVPAFLFVGEGGPAGLAGFGENVIGAAG